MSVLEYRLPVMPDDERHRRITTAAGTAWAARMIVVDNTCWTQRIGPFDAVLTAAATCQDAVMDSAIEVHLRQMIFERLDELRAEHGVVRRTQLEALQVGGQTVRVIDRNRGIWNPAHGGDPVDRLEPDETLHRCARE